MTNKEASERLYVEIFGRGNLDVADELMSPDVVSHGLSEPPRSGTDGIKRQAMLLRGAMPDLSVHLEFQLQDGDFVTSYWRGIGNHTGALRLPGMEVPPTGNRVEFTEIRIDRFANGRIVEAWFNPDRYGAWQQLGLIQS